MPLVTAEGLGGIYRAVAVAYGADAREADVFSKCFLRADLRAHSTQGIGYLPLVVEWLRDGVIHFGRRLSVISETPATLVLDGHNGVGQVLATDAMDLAITKARTAGIGCVWLRHGNDFTMAANYAMQALDHDMVGLAMSNGAPETAGWGGRTAILGTNPLAVAFPAPPGPPVVIDMATSSLSHGQVVLAARDGTRLDRGVLVGSDGRIVSDAVQMVVDPAQRESPLNGSILPLGPKGFGWMLIVELFTALLSGMNTSVDIVYPPTEAVPTMLGQFFMAIDIAQVVPLERFQTTAARLVEVASSSPPAEGSQGVRVPGSAAALEEARRQIDGIPVRDEEWEILLHSISDLAIDATAALVRRDDVEQVGDAR